MKQKNALHTKVTPRQKLQLKLLWFIAGIAFSIIAGVLIFLVLYGGFPTASEAEIDNTYESVATGLWDSDATWKNSAPATESAPENAKIIINRGHEVTVPGDLEIGEGTKLDVQGTAVVRENLRLKEGSSVNVAEDGIFMVMGDYVARENVAVTNDGRMVLVGDGVMNEQSQLDNSGTLYASNEPGLMSGTEPMALLDAQNDDELTQLMEYNGFSFTTLPIKLGNFKARNKTNKVQLEWTTLTEVNNDFFTIERSRDGKKFEVLGTVNGMGNSKSAQHYSYTDLNPYSGTSYYILKQTDFDGQYEYFKAIRVKREAYEFEENPLQLVSVGPNPFNEHVNIQYSVTQTGPVEIQLVNLMGQHVFTASQTAYAGSNSYRIAEGAKLKDEIYILNLVYNGKTSKSLKIVKR